MRNTLRPSSVVPNTQVGDTGKPKFRVNETLPMVFREVSRGSREDPSSLVEDKGNLRNKDGWGSKWYLTYQSPNQPPLKRDFLIFLPGQVQIRQANYKAVNLQ